ncbi:MAG: tetratricopeptide repeat protein [Gemmataceae bacterium]|nr:tetratricopeptide repeat protein [Gemmataceae bacterium]
MAAATTEPELDRLLAEGRWAAARKVIERELAADPGNHWLRTQLGVTHYEQRRYREALKHFAASLAIVPDCPLTLWNVAGTLDALGRAEEAVPVYLWLLGSKKTPDDDPCWESREWTDALKTDCVYRLGTCLQHLGRAEAAEHCFRRYVNLLLDGMSGTYPIEDAARHVRDLYRNGKPKPAAAFAATLRDPAVRAVGNGRRGLPKLDLGEFLAGRP